jgi:hypothetical protein
MKSSWIARLLLLAASLAFCVSVARAQDSTTSRVVRLSRTDGQVLVSHPGNDTWDEAAVNLPLQEGDTLATQGGMAEVEFENGATAYLAENSVLQFTQLGFSGDGRVTQLNLTQGAGSFYANPTRQDSFHVVTSTFEVAIPERAEVRVDAFRDGASIEVLSGEVSVSTSKGSTTFEKGESVAIHQDDLQNPKVARLPDQDAFDQWVSQQSEVIQSGSKNTLNYINSPNSYGLSDLAIYGSWVYLTGYGNSWRPFSAGFSWTPYMNGNWTLDPRLGWIWVSSEPWGWMPFHFGSWLLSPALGWVWVPGDPAGLRDWQGARVNWVRSGNQVGWVPKSPNDRDGAPANLQHGFVTTAGISQPNRNGSNQVVAGRNLQNAAPLKQPPADLASSLVRPAPRSGPASIVRTIPQAREASGSVVIERGTHTFINGNPSSVAVTPATAAQPRQATGIQSQSGLRSGGLQAGPGPRSGGLPFETPGKQAQPGLHSGGLQAQPAPESKAHNEGRRVTIPPPGPMDSQTRRVNLPPPGPAPLSRMLPNGVNSPTNSSVPPASRPGVNPPQSMQVAPPRPMIPPAQPPPQPRYAPPPPAPQLPAAAPQTNSVARPAAPAQAGPEPARSTAGTTGRQR